MSVEALAWAFTVPLPPSEKLVLLALADRSGNRFDCYPSVTDVTMRTGLSDRTVRTAIASLAHRSVIRIERRKHSGHGGWTSSLYEMLVDGDTRRRLEERLQRARGQDADPQPEDAPPPATAAHPPIANAAAPLMRRLPDMNRHLEPEESQQAPARESSSKGVGSPPPPTTSPAATTVASLELPLDWKPSPEDRAYATGLGLDPDALVQDFVGYWTSRPPGKGLSRRWSWNWERWCRNEIEFRAERSQRPDRALKAVAATHRAGAAPHAGMERVPADLVPSIETRLASPEARPLWSWALSRPDVRFFWDTSGPKPMAAFNAGKGVLNRIIIDLVSDAGIERINAGDCTLVADWMAELEHVGDAVEIASTIIRRGRARWKSDQAPFSLRPFDNEIRAALANAGRASAKRRGALATAM